MVTGATGAWSLGGRAGRRSATCNGMFAPIISYTHCCCPWSAGGTAVGAGRQGCHHQRPQMQLLSPGQEAPLRQGHGQGSRCGYCYLDNRNQSPSDYRGTVTGLVPQGQCRERTQLAELFGMRTIRVPPILALRGFSKLADYPPQTTNKHGH